MTITDDLRAWWQARTPDERATLRKLHGTVVDVKEPGIEHVIPQGLERQALVTKATGVFMLPDEFLDDEDDEQA
jgi:hypothetical protein